MRKLLFIILLLIAPCAYAAGPEKKTETKSVNSDEGIIADLDVFLGDEKAPVTVVEYASLSCSHCAAFEASAFPYLKEHYIDTGKVKFIMRNFPLDSTALQGAQLAHCAGSDKYYDVLHTLFSEQDTWVYAQNTAASLKVYGGQYGLTPEQVDSCLKDEKLKERIAAVATESKKIYGISSTPSFVIDGEKMDMRDMDDMSRKIDARLKLKQKQ